MDNIVETLTKYPWIVAIGALIGLFLFSRSAPASQAGGDYAATLASQQIATDGAIALSSISGQENIVATQARRDIILGAQNMMIADKSITADLVMSSMANATHVADTNALSTVEMFTAATGYLLGTRSLKNDADAMQKSYDLGMSGIMSDRITTSMALDYKDKASVRDYNLGVGSNNLTFDLANLNAVLETYLNDSYYDNYTNITDNQLRLNTQADNTDIAITNSNNALISQLGHQQIKIARANAKANLLGGLMNLAGTLGTAAIARGT